MSGFEFGFFLAALSVVGVVIVLLRPRIPPWVSLPLHVGLVIYGVVLIVQDGPHVVYFALVAFFAWAAFDVWWRDIRGTRVRRQQGP